MLTSAAAVPVLVDRAQESAGSLTQLLADGRVRVAAIGPGTARALREAGVEPDLVPRGQSSSRALVEAWPEPAEPARVLFPRGDLAAATVTDGLRQRGWEVTDVVAYRTVSAAPPPDDVREAWTDGTIRAALLTSASTVRELAARLGPPPTTTQSLPCTRNHSRPQSHAGSGRRLSPARHWRLRGCSRPITGSATARFRCALS